MKLILKADGKLKLSVSALFPKAKAGIDFASRARHVEVFAQSESGVDTTRNFARYQVKAA